MCGVLFCLLFYFLKILKKNHFYFFLFILIPCFSGDMSKGDDIKLSNRVFNHMKRFSDRAERSRRRLRDQKDVSTHAMALDANTRLILYKLVNAGYLKEVHGAFSMGKESVVFHGINYSVPEDVESPLEECAIKVFKTTLTEFKQRQQFLQGDRRFDARVGKQV